VFNSPFLFLSQRVSGRVDFVAKVFGCEIFALAIHQAYIPFSRVLA
jgi:hypothetical protein